MQVCPDADPRPGVAGLAGDVGHGRGSEAGQAAGLRDADLDHAGIGGRPTGGGGGQRAGVAPGLGLAGPAGGGAGAVWRRGRGGAGGGDSQQRLSAHGQHGVPAEGAPQPHLVLIQARLPFSLLVAFFCGPSLPGHRDQGRQRRRPALRDMAVVESQVRRVGEAAADQHPVPRRGGGGPRPGVVAVASKMARPRGPRR